MNWFNLYSDLYDPFMALTGLYRPDHVIRALKPLPGELILDLCGGTGLISGKIAGCGCTVAVLDHTLRMLARAKRRGVSACCGKAESLPFRNRSFDACICIDGLHHIRGLRMSLKEMIRVLRPGARIVVMEFDFSGSTGRILHLFERLLVDRIRPIAPEKLAAEMRRFGVSGSIERVNNLMYLFAGSIDKHVDKLEKIS
ncbi:MAG: methyltransferase domain-containing protein [Candidatus Wallbacteria bacterium]|nr:methyltransferase domain-containing protein [Candidatus Wallbacteria bacterium]